MFSSSKKTCLHQAAYQVLMQANVPDKLHGVRELKQQWQQQGLIMGQSQSDIQSIPIPGRPTKPILVDPKEVKQRKLGTSAGRAALLHAVAHIEFNAINLALDAVYRFQAMPMTYYDEWLQVAYEEAYHFQLVCERMAEMGLVYGDLPAHNGLWEQACKTDHDVLVRMALVPRVLEARGLDVTPPMIQRLQQAGDEQTVAVLQVILADEIGHVRIGSHWFRYCCAQRQLPVEETFRQLLQEYLPYPLRGPFYEEGRLQAGFSHQELLDLVALEQTWLKEIRQ